VSQLAGVLDQLGIRVDAQLMDLALTHRSWAYENGRGATNERLEFLGDSILGAIVTEHIFRCYPDRSEGQLAKVRAAVVSGHCLAQVARDLTIGSVLKLGRGEIATHGEAKDSILADALEAVVGAVHLTGGFLASAAFVHHIFDPIIVDAMDLGAGLDWKSSLQELTSSLNAGTPDYSCEVSGPDHERIFSAEVRVRGELLGSGVATSKRGAEQKAAEVAYETLMRTSIE